MLKLVKNSLFHFFFSFIFASRIFLLKLGKDKKEYLTQTASRKTILQTVSSTGTLVSESKINLDFEVTGRIKDVRVKIGDRIAKGEILAEIENEILGQEVEKARLALEKAIAIAGANDDKVREAEQEVENAEDYLDKVEDLEDQKVNAAEEGYDDATDYYEDALDYYNKIEDEHGADSSEAKNAKLTLTSALKSKNSAEEAKKQPKRQRI